MKLKSKTTLYSALLVLWLLLLAGALIYPLWGRVVTKSSQLEEKREKIAQLETQSKQLDSLQQTLKKAKSDFKALGNLFINHEAPVSFLEFLEQAAADFNVDISISPGSGQKSNEPWPPSFFDIKGTGDFGNCIKYVESLEYAPYLIEIQSLSLEKGEVEGEEGTKEKTKFNLSLKVY